MSKIVIVGEGMYPFFKSGYSRYNTAMAKDLKDAGHEVYFLPTHRLFTLDIDGVTILQPLAEDQLGEKSLYDWLKVIKPDKLIIAGDWWFIAMFIPIRVDVESYAVLWVDGEPLPPNACYMLEYFDHIIAPSKYATKLYDDIGFKSIYAPPKIDLNSFHKVDCGKTFELGTVSRFLRRKGFEVTLTALTKLPEYKAYFHIETQDQGAPFDFKGWVKYLGLIGRVGVPNAINVSDSHLNLLYNMLKCHVLLSHSEGFGIPTVEAMACGIPSVCTNYSSQTELVPKECGELVNIKDFYVNNAGVKWARPDVNDAVEKIQYVVENYESYSNACINFAKQYEIGYWNKVL